MFCSHCLLKTSGELYKVFAKIIYLTVSRQLNKKKSLMFSQSNHVCYLSAVNINELLLIWLIVKCQSRKLPFKFFYNFTKGLM